MLELDPAARSSVAGFGSTKTLGERTCANSFESVKCGGCQQVASKKIMVHVDCFRGRVVYFGLRGSNPGHALWKSRLAVCAEPKRHAAPPIV